ncbi:protein kinase domain-containing protein [Haliangium sp.]|uniref:protein kinase domain-containing protein n=1 Tax=Haliangium sp. TaxID=2663208 RepID=UPI003D0AF771
MRASHVFPPGTIIGGQFELGALIAQGGMGAVYRATQRGTGAQRAVKLMHPRLVKQAHSRTLFLREAQVSALIRSEHVVHVIAAGVDDATGVPWLAMELLDGLDLAAYLSQHGPMPPADVAVVVEQIGHALGAAHDEGIVHRDLKPENVFLASAHRVGTPYVVKLLDFGVAKFTAQVRTESVLVGTPAYMAPEQASESDQVSPATDLWSLGLLVFRMLVGRSYWRQVGEQGARGAALWREILFDPLDLASERAAGFDCEHLVPRHFDEWFIRCVSRDPRARFQDARAAVVTLVELLAPGRGELAEVGGAETFALLRERAGAEVSITRADTVPLLGPSAIEPDGELVRVCFQSRLGRVEVHAPKGVWLLDVSRTNGLTHTSVCGGQARCTTCRVVVLRGREHLSPPTERERAVARHKQWLSDIRLACQTRVLGDVTVRRLVLDSEDVALIEEEPETPTFADKRAACVLATSARGLDEFLRTALAYDGVHVVNRLVSQVRSVIERNGGRVVCTGGGDLVAVFGHDSGDHAEAAARALRAALRIMARVALVNEHFVRHFGVKVKVAVGLDHGEVFTGDVSGQSGHVFGEAVTVACAAARAAGRDDLRVVGSERLVAVITEPVRTGRRVEVGASPAAEDLAEGEAQGQGLVELMDFQKPDAVHLVQATFEQVLARADEFSAAFYARLFTLDPGIEALFDEVDMERQQTMLIKALDVILRGFDDVSAIRLPLRALARRHIAYGIKVGHYKVLGDALLWALEVLLGDAFVAEVSRAWMETYGKIARIMVEAHLTATGESSGDNSTTGTSPSLAARALVERAADEAAAVRASQGEDEPITEPLQALPRRDEDEHDGDRAPTETQSSS